MLHRSLGHRAPLLWLVLPLIAGLAGQAAVPPGAIGPVLFAAALGCGGAWLCSFRRPRTWAALLCLGLALAGAAAGVIAQARLPAWTELPPREARLGLRVDRLFAIAYPERTSGLATVVATAPHLRDLRGQRVYFSLTLPAGTAPPIRSATLAAIGVLASLPPAPPADTFEGYLATAGINFRFSRGRLLATTDPGSAYQQFCAAAAAAFHRWLGLGIAEKRPALAALLRAMMLGQTHELSDEQHGLFMQSGTMHLFAISGLNIGVVAGALQALMLLLRLPAWPRFALGTVLLWLFVDITGGAPSAVRAFVMAVFFQAAFVLRRPRNLLAALAASALLVLLAAPLQVFGASFLMSYGIVAALLLLGLPLGEAWLKFWTPWRALPVAAWHRVHHAVAAGWRFLASALAVGLATSLVSILTGLQYFGLLTPGGLVANLLLIPAAMAVTLAGFASLACGLVGFESGAVLANHAGALVLLVIESAVRLGVAVPGAFFAARFAAPWVGPVALAALLLALVLGYAGNWEKRVGGWWPPFAVVAVTLIGGVNYGAVS